MIGFLITFVRVAANVFSILIIAKVILSYFMSPYHPIRSTIDRIIEPLMAPIRKCMPNTGMFDFSPVVLLIIIQIMEILIISVLAAF